MIIKMKYVEEKVDLEEIKRQHMKLSIVNFDWIKLLE